VGQFAKRERWHRDAANIQNCYMIYETE